jgi:hypothetical protein
MLVKITDYPDYRDYQFQINTLDTGCTYLGIVYNTDASLVHYLLKDKLVICPFCNIHKKPGKLTFAGSCIIYLFY